jgi:tetratricopeptide (TPR) repeat protein
LGYALLDADRPAEAWPAFDQALRSDELSGEKLAEWQNAAAYARAIGSEDPSEWELGLRLVEAALEQEPENPNRLDTLGWLLCRLGRTAEGHSTLRRAATLMPEGPSVEVSEHLEACTIR